MWPFDGSMRLPGLAQIVLASLALGQPKGAFNWTLT